MYKLVLIGVFWLATLGVEASAQPTRPAPMDTPDKPGYFRLDKSNDDKVCHALGHIINVDIKKYGETRFDEHDEFVKWHAIDEARITRGEGISRYSGSVEQADVDINNDGVVDQAIRSKWAVGRVEHDAVNVFPQDDSRKIDIIELIKGNKEITFSSGEYWRDRYHKKYDDPYLLKGDWYFDSGVSIELFRSHGATYVVAQDYATLPRDIAANITLQKYKAQPDVSAKIFVFQIDKEYRKYEERDVCMFVRTCPCGGCKDVRGTTEEARALPGKKWCNN